MERILPDIARVLDVPPDAEDALADEFADDPARPADLWQPASLPAELPIGRILKLDAVLPVLKEGASHGGADRGESNAESAGWN